MIGGFRGVFAIWGWGWCREGEDFIVVADLDLPNQKWIVWLLNGHAFDNIARVLLKPKYKLGCCEWCWSFERQINNNCCCGNSDENPFVTIDLTAGIPGKCY